MLQCPACGAKYTDEWKICLQCDNTALVAEGSADPINFKSPSVKKFDPGFIHIYGGPLVSFLCMVLFSNSESRSEGLGALFVFLIGLVLTTLTALLVYQIDDREKAFSLSIATTTVIQLIILISYVSFLTIKYSPQHWLETAMWVPVMTFSLLGLAIPVSLSISYQIYLGYSEKNIPMPNDQRLDMDHVIQAIGMSSFYAIITTWVIWLILTNIGILERLIA